MYLPKLREIKEALVSLFTKPFTTKYPRGEYQPHEHYRGFPEYKEEDCIGCGACAEVCPAHAISFTDDHENNVRIMEVNYFYCFNCGQCEERCTTETGIQLQSDLYSFASSVKGEETQFNRIEKELVYCENCGATIACRDHLLFVKEQLGAKAYAHPNLMLETQKNFTRIGPSKFKDKIRREDYIKEVCPNCRHRIVTEDEFK